MQFPFPLDEFQREAIQYLEQRESVVVCAPTGSGKTVIAEYAIERALSSRQRSFYTTPLKALSNQKFFDFRQKYGDEGVGLLTGDTSINRDAPLVVMTTEVFRNMLYGTILGEVRHNLHDVSCVILDECHYMNDRERGTVWEESIIYAPPNIQIVALSATIANASDLTEWINETHGPTSLVLSNHRPVPLRFYYFGDRRLYPLLSPGGGLNTQLKGRFGRQKTVFRPGRLRPGALLPSPADVLGALSSRDMLPAIYFLFSRRGCEESMRKARGIPLLSLEEEEELKRCIESYIRDNPNLQNHPHLPYLYEGMSVHHAGMLPSWKAMVEKLFQRGLLKVVFATETLAAGINMPARTTVISSLGKRGDDGHRPLTASEFLQMSGRAGRRGMDEIGQVVILSSKFEPVEDAAKLAVAPADPLLSRFAPSYGMVLNLLQRHTIEEARDLIERSFGQFLVSDQFKPLYQEKLSMEAELKRLSHPLCPGELGDLNQYSNYLEAVRSQHKQLKQMEKGVRGDRTAIQETEFLKNKIKEFLDKAYAMPCHGCPVQKPCSNQTDRIHHLKARLKEINRRLEYETTKNWRTFEALSNILRAQGYLDGNVPTELGCMAAGIRGNNELFLCEVAINGCLDGLKPSEFAGAITALVGDDGKGQPSQKVSIPVAAALSEMEHIARKIYRLQKDFEVDIPVTCNPTLSPLTEMWAQGASWEDIRIATMLDEGDIVRSIRRTVDLCRQFQRAPNVPQPLVNLCASAEALLARDEIKEEF